MDTPLVPSPDPVTPADATTTATATATSTSTATTTARRGRTRASIRLAGIAGGLIVIALVLIGVQTFASRHQASDNGGLHFVIPAGAADSLEVPTIDSAIAIPTRIVFKEGEPAVLSIRNDDSVANRAGPWVIGPGQTYTARFDQPGTYEYACTVDATESVTIIVEGDA